MIFVVRRDIHSSMGKSKKVKQASMDLSRQATADGIAFAHLDLNSPYNAMAVSFDGA